MTEDASDNGDDTPITTLFIIGAYRRLVTTHSPPRSTSFTCTFFQMPPEIDTPCRISSLVNYCRRGQLFDLRLAHLPFANPDSLSRNRSC